MKEQIKTRYYGLLVSMPTPSAVDKFFRRYSVVTLCIIMLLCFATFAFASGESLTTGKDVFEAGKALFWKIYTSILGISTAAAVVAEGIACFLYFFSSSGKTVEQAKDWMKRIAIGWLIINAMGVIVATARSFVSGFQLNESQLNNPNN